MEGSAKVLTRKAKALWHDILGHQKTIDGEKNQGETNKHPNINTQNDINDLFFLFIY